MLQSDSAKVFCQSAIESAQNDHAMVVQSMVDNKAAHLAKIKALFSDWPAHSIYVSHGQTVIVRGMYRGCMATLRKCY